MTPPDDDRSDLLGRWADDGDREALDQLLRLELDPVKRSFRRRLARSAKSPSLDTSDYVDEAVGRLLRQSPAPEFDSPEKLRAYLTQAAVNLFVNHYHGARRKPVHLTVDDLGQLLQAPEGRSLSKDLDLQEFRDAVQLALNLLDEDECRLLEAALVKGRSVRQIADDRDEPKSTVARRLERAKANLVLKMLSWREWLQS